MLLPFTATGEPTVTSCNRVIVPPSATAATASAKVSYFVSPMDASYIVSLTEYVPSACRVRVYPSAQYSFFTSSENVPPEMDFFFTSTLPVKLPPRMDILEFGAVTAVGPSTVPPTIEIMLPLLPLMAVINVSLSSLRSASTLPPFIMNVP